MTDLQAPLFLVAGLAAVAGLAIGLPPWRAYRARQALTEEEDRYLEWRGRARTPGTARGSPMTSRERWRIVAGVGLGVVAVVSLLIGLASS